MQTDKQVFIGWDPREPAPFAVARHSVRHHLPACVPVHGLILSDLKEAGLYTRPMEMRASSEKPIMWDVISDAPMSTEHACARFLVPKLAKTGWALFMDADMLVCGDLGALLDSLDPKYAVYCVKHNHTPPEGVKMDGQMQTRYARKNWTSFMVFNCDHPSNERLTVEMINTLPGRDLHRFCWLEDDEIGELDPSWNFLVGHSDPNIVPKNIHWTEGTPDMAGYENAPYADMWRAQLALWAA
jgi:lipopolysaccharide biosynthesis glycosyltransferase